MVRNRKFIWHRLTPSWQLGLMSALAALVMTAPFLWVFHNLRATNYSINPTEIGIYQGLILASHGLDRKESSQDQLVMELPPRISADPAASQLSLSSDPAQNPTTNQPKSTTPLSNGEGGASLALYPELSAKWPKEILQWGNLLGKYCVERDKISINLAAALILRESWFPVKTYPEGFRRCPDGPSSSSCTSSVGAIGIMQVMPFHAKPGENLRDPATNISKGCSILRSYIDRMGSIRAGLAAYNAGPDGANQGVGWGFADSVLRYLDQYK